MIEVSVLPLAIVALLYLPALRHGLNLADEGYLWFGSREILRGQIPIRDFRAYDPGRYVWSALWMSLLGGDLIAIRIGLLVAQALGLCAFAMSLELATHDPWVTAFGTVLLAAWMHPRHKQLDAAIPAIALLVAVAWVQAPRVELFAAAGVFAGLCFFFGLNHGLYVVCGNVVLMAGLAVRGDGGVIGSSAPWWALGVLVGLTPTLGLLGIVPGMLRQYWELKVMRILRRGSSNLPLVIPWIWRPAPVQLQGLPQWGRCFPAIVLTLMPVVFGLGVTVPLLASDFGDSGHVVLFAGASLGLFYMHQALSRADISHLCQAVAPWLFCVAALSAGLEWGWLLLVVLAVPSWWLVYGRCSPFPWWQRRRPSSVAYLARDETLHLASPLVDYLNALREIVEAHSDSGDRVLILPTLVTLYPLLERRPAIYDLFCPYPADAIEQEAMLRELRCGTVPLALVLDAPLDGRDELRFPNTHPLVWRYLHESFTALGDTGRLPSDHHVFVQKTSVVTEGTALG